MWNRLVIAFLLFSFIVPMQTGCTLQLPVETKHYVVYRENDRYYMRIKSPIPMEPFADWQTFQSAKEMATAILNGTLSEEMINSLRQVLSPDGVREICNLDALCDLHMPEDTAVWKLRWTGSTFYNYECISVDVDSSMTVTCSQAEDYFKIKQQYGPQQSGSILPEVLDSDPYAIVTTQPYIQGPLTRYEIHTQSRTYWVYERDSRSLGREKYAIYFGCDQPVNGLYLTALFFVDHDKRPSAEWISSFWLVPL